MKKLLFGIITNMVLFVSCSQDDNETNKNNHTPNWKIVKNFPEDKSYETAKIAVHNGKPYITTYGHSGIIAGSEGAFSNEFSGTFFFLNGNDWYMNVLPDQAVIALKEFNGSLYGIREKKTVFQTSPVLEHQHSYTLFKWENNNYTDLDVLEYTDLYQQEKSMLRYPDLWINNNKLHVVAGTTLSTLKIWEVNSENKLVIAHNEISPLPPNDLLITDNKEIAYTSVQTVVEAYITRYYVKGHYFNNGTLTIGNTHEFYTEQLVGGGIWNSTKDVSWQAVNGSLFGMGFENNKVKNHDNGQIIANISSGKVFREDIMVRNNGKLYMMLGAENEVSACKGLAIFDGTTFREIPFNLPEPLDPCSRLIDATEHNGKIYLLLNNRGQYVVVESI